MTATNKILAFVLLLVFAATPLWAQTHVAPGTNAESASSSPGVSSITNNAPATPVVPLAQVPPAPGISSNNHGEISNDGSESHNRISTEDMEPERSTLKEVAGIIAIVAGCGLPVAILGIIFYYAHRRNKLLHETLRAFVEKGAPIPPELLATKATQSANRTQNDLRRGLILIAVGAGVIMISGDVGYIILFIGVAFLAMALMQGRPQTTEKKDKDNEPANK